jgi:nitroreductase
MLSEIKEKIIMEEIDKYQERYLNHKERKTVNATVNVDYKYYTHSDMLSLLLVMQRRRSQRTYNEVCITDEEIAYITEAINSTPSSCNRQAIYLIPITQEIADKYLVGAKNWVMNADKVFLVMADKLAYKNPAEQSFMPYLDAGFVGQSIYLMSEVLNIGCCFINPNIRDENKEDFKSLYGDDYICGAIALGHYDTKAIKPPKRELKEVIRYD